MTHAAAARPLPPGLLSFLREESDPASLTRRLDLPTTPLDPESWEQALFGPARDFLSRPGKGFRGKLVELGWEMGGGPARSCPADLPFIVELLHAGSLIVDDVEDGAAHRRGEPALHHTWGIPLAINTGTWMYFAALDRIARLDVPPPCAARLQQDAVRTLLRCHHGQALDLAIDVLSLRQSEVRRTVEATTRLKTGCLVAFAASAGAVAAQAPSHVVEALSQLGMRLGVALQMLDDRGSILSPARLEKGLEDVRERRPTWPWAWAASSADEVGYARLVRTARRSLSSDPGAVVEALQRALPRDRATEPHELLARALADVERATGPSRALEEVREHARVLEAAYA